MDWPAAILVLAAAVRLIGLEETPPGLWYDEAGIGLEARRILDEPAFRPMYAEGTTSPAAFIYLVALAEGVLGQTVTAVRVVPALMGTATALLAYWVAGSLWGRWAGIAAGILFAVSRWDINFSRIGMQGESAPLFTVGAFGLALMALRTGHPRAYAGLGLVLGAFVWCYGANVFFLPVVLAGLAVLAFQRRDFLRGHAPGLALAAGGVLLVAAPVVADGIARPEVVFSRAEVVSVFRDHSPAEAAPVIVESLRKHLAMFHLEGDKNGRHNLPGTPMLDPATGALVLLGLAAAVHQASQPALATLLVWGFVLLLPGVLSLPFEAPQGLRAIGALPAALVLAAFGLERLRAFWIARLGPRATVTVLAGWLGLAGATNLYTYFWVQASDAQVWNAFSMAQTIIGRDLVGDPSEQQARYVSALHTSHPTTSFLAPSVSYRTLDPGVQLPLGAGRRTTIFLAPEDEAVYELVRNYYPDAACSGIRHNPKAAVTLYRCTVTEDQIRAVWGLSREGSLQSGSLHAPVSGPYRVGIEGGAGWSLDEQSMESPAGLLLRQGLHGVSIQGPSGRLFWQPPGEEWQPVPEERLFHGNVRPMGLTVSYYRGAAPEGEPALTRVEPGPFVYYHLLPLDLPFFGLWTGSVYAPVSGRYRFTLSTISQASLDVDGVTVVSATTSTSESAGSIALAEGWHRITVRHLAADPYTQLYLRWQPPGAAFSVIPPRFMWPR